MVEATGVELFSVLITRKLLIPGITTTVKKAPIAQSIVRLLYENAFSFWSPTDTTWRHQCRIDSQGWIEKAPSFLRYRKYHLSVSSVDRLTVSITSGLSVTREQLPRCEQCPQLWFVGSNRTEFDFDAGRMMVGPDWVRRGSMHDTAETSCCGR
jgi:hypothetical protein